MVNRKPSSKKEFCRSNKILLAVFNESLPGYFHSHKQQQTFEHQMDWTEKNSTSNWFTQITIKPFEQTIHYENTLMTFCIFPKRSLKKYKPGHPEYFLLFREMLIQHFVFASPMKEHHCVTVNWYNIPFPLSDKYTGNQGTNMIPYTNVQFQKISILPPQKGSDRGFCKAKKFKEMYEA